MPSKFLAALLFVAASATAYAAPTYEVTFPGEAPVRLTLDGLGRASAESDARAFNFPALAITVQSRKSELDNMRMHVVHNVPSFDEFGTPGATLQMPVVHTVDYFKVQQLLPAQQLELPIPGNAGASPDVTIKLKRID